MKHLFKLSLLLLALLLPVSALAYDFEVDGIYYNIDTYNSNNVIVTYKDTNYNSYSGDIVIPNSVTYNGKTYSVASIGFSAFKGCTTLTNVDIPNSVTYIGYSAFNGCTTLTSVDIPNSVTEIGNYAFDGCSGLTSVTIPNSVTTIGSNAFAYSGLTSVTIPNSVTTIGTWAFLYCSGLNRVDITDIVAWCNISFADDNSNPLYYANHLYLNGVEVTNLTIPNSVTSIGNYAFYQCSGLTSVTIPNSVTSIGTYAFAYSGLTSITIPNSVTTIGYGVFYNCSGLTSVTIPNSVTTIGSNAFAYSGLTSVTIPNSVTTIVNEAFAGCRGLTDITIPNSVTTISDKAFWACDYLACVTIPNSVTTIGNEAFARCRLNEVYSYITDPLHITMGIDVFYPYKSNRTLYVPEGTFEVYKTYGRWSDFFDSIVEMEFVPTAIAESIKLNVTTAGLNEGATLQLTAMVQPEEGTSKKMNWASSDPSVATVDNNGLVTTHSVGTATITAMTSDGSNLSASCTVTLLPVGVKGDVNGDNIISISDVTSLIDYLLSGAWN